MLAALLDPAAAPIPPDLATALRRIAQLGGYLGRTGDGPPGVKTIWRGLRRFHDLVLGVQLARTSPSLLDDR